MKLSLDRPWVVVALAIGLVLIVSTLSRVATGVRKPVAAEVLSQTDVLLKAANKWAVLSTQDGNPLLALMHICYAKAYIACLRRILSDDQIQRAHKVSMVDLEQRMDMVEQGALATISQAAPSLLPEGEFAVRTGWLG